MLRKDNKLNKDTPGIAKLSNPNISRSSRIITHFLIELN